MASRIEAECTETARFWASSYTKSPTRDWMLPSKMIPTNSALRLITGLPELPPMMSHVDTKLNGVLESIACLCLCHVGGKAQGALLWCCSACWNAPPKVVHGSIHLPLSW